MSHRTLHSFPTRRSSDLRRGRSSFHKVICFRPRNRPSLNYKGFPTRRFQGCSRNNADTFRTNQVDILPVRIGSGIGPDRKSTRLNSSHVEISYAVFCLKKKNICNATYFEGSRAGKVQHSDLEVESDSEQLSPQSTTLSH